MIEDVLSSLHNQLKKTQVKVAIECAADLSVSGAPGIIEQVLLNLVQNSLLHGYPDPAVAGLIRITAQVRDKHLHLEYHDDGLGMSADTAARVFEPYFTTRRSEGGSGLGLYVCYNLVNQEGGTIQCHSAWGEGVRFRIGLPVE